MTYPLPRIQVKIDDVEFTFEPATHTIFDVVFLRPKVAAAIRWLYHLDDYLEHMLKAHTERSTGSLYAALREHDDPEALERALRASVERIEKEKDKP